MPHLHVSNGFRKNIVGLAKHREFSTLSQKRVTKCVREELRAAYGLDNVHVSCSAKFLGALWNGQCTINESKLTYVISADPPSSG